MKNLHLIYKLNIIAAILLLIIIIISLSSCTSIREMEDYMYVQSLYKQCLKTPDCGTDMDFELIDRKIYDRLYSCDRYPAHEF